MVLKYDVSGEDHAKNAGGGWTPPKNNSIHACRITDCKVGRKDKNDPETERLEIVYTVLTEGEHAGFRGYEYINLGPASKWKMDQFLQAVGINTEEKSKGTANEKEWIGSVVKVRFKDDPYVTTDDEGNKVTSMKAKPAGVYRFNGDAADFAGKGTGPFDDEETGGSGADTGEDEADLDALAEAADGGDEEAEAALRGYLEAVGSEIDPDEIATWAEVVELVRAELDEAPDADDAEVKDYSEWEVPDLRAECKKRELNSVGAKPVLIGRLEKYDRENPLSED